MPISVGTNPDINLLIKDFCVAVSFAPLDDRSPDLIEKAFANVHDFIWILVGFDTFVFYFW